MLGKIIRESAAISQRLRKSSGSHFAVSQGLGAHAAHAIPEAKRAALEFHEVPSDSSTTSWVKVLAVCSYRSGKKSGSTSIEALERLRRTYVGGLAKDDEARVRGLRAFH